MRRWLAVVLVPLIVGVLLLSVRLPYYAEGPGPTEEVAPLLDIKDHSVFPSKGTFLITTVSQSAERLSLAELFWVWLDPHEQVLSEDAVLGPEGDPVEELRMAQEQMDESQMAATSIALRAAAGYPSRHGAGVLVAAVQEGCPGAGVLFAGESILAVGDVSVDSFANFSRAVDAIPDSRVISLTVSREGERESRTVDVTRAACIQGETNRMIGGLFVPTFPFPVTMSDENIGGPSAGLAWALGLYDRLTPGDLTGGRTIAVTGGLDLDGSVFPIGGIDKKVVGAQAAGATVFLVPRENLKELEGVDVGDMKVVPVDSFKDAVQDLGGTLLKGAA